MHKLVRSKKATVISLSVYTGGAKVGILIIIITCTLYSYVVNATMAGNWTLWCYRPAAMLVRFNSYGLLFWGVLRK